jgi:hypothetical protein
MTKKTSCVIGNSRFSGTLQVHLVTSLTNFRPNAYFGCSDPCFFKSQPGTKSENLSSPLKSHTLVLFPPFEYVHGSFCFIPFPC